MSRIANSYGFTQDRYRKVDLSSPEKQLVFAVRHSLLHMTKSSGKIAAELEAHDHGAPVNEHPLRVAAAKQVINALNLADALGMTEADIIFFIEETLKRSP